jgi:hypothetical protein
MKVILVVGSWGSGTSALAGSLCHLGIPGFGPYWQTKDPRTPNTYELNPFRNLLIRYINQRELVFPSNQKENLRIELVEFRNQLEEGLYGKWQEGTEKRVMLKFPLAAFCLPQLCDVFDVDIIVSLRRFDDIEATRQRRGWGENYGKKGAQIIYPTLFADMLQMQKSYLAVGYTDLVLHPKKTLQKIVNYCDLSDIAGNIPEGAKFIRPDFRQ